MDTVIIRQAIVAAKKHERVTGQLARLLTTRVSALHKSIQLPSENIIPALLNFIIHYIDQVPEFIDAVDAIADECGLIDYIEPVISTARGYNMPLVPMDMTRSNLIIHHLIGEPFANQLDSAVHLIVDELQQKDLVFVPEACREDRSNRWASDLQRWPCLIDNLSVNLLFNGSGQLLIH